MVAAQRYGQFAAETGRRALVFFRLCVRVRRQAIERFCFSAYLRRIGFVFECDLGHHFAAVVRPRRYADAVCAGKGEQRAYVGYGIGSRHLDVDGLYFALWRDRRQYAERLIDILAQKRLHRLGARDAEANERVRGMIYQAGKV